MISSSAAVEQYSVEMSGARYMSTMFSRKYASSCRSVGSEPYETHWKYLKRKT